MVGSKRVGGVARHEKEKQHVSSCNTNMQVRRCPLPHMSIVVRVTSWSNRHNT